MSILTAESIAHELGKAKQSGSGWVSQCPAHDDRQPSLSITDQGDGKVLFHCHAGCSQESVMEKLRQRGIWPELSSTSYDYVDANGQLLYQVVRGKGKKFQQRRPDGNGGWIWKLDEVTKVPYRLPDLTKALSSGTTIFIVEGEKDSDSLVRLGLVATTNSGGAGKWGDAHSKYLEGAKEIIVLPDNDEPGLRHAEQVAASLTQINVPLKVVALPDLPAKGDVSDWIANGGTKDDLLRLCENTPNWTLGSSCNPSTSKPDWTNPETFGIPVLFNEGELPQITTEFLPSWVKSYVDGVAEQTQTAPAMASMLVLAVLAACLQKRFRVSPYHDGYSEPLSLWTLVAAPPGSRKTAVLQTLCEPLTEWERERGEELGPKIEENKIVRHISLKRIEELTRQASKLEY